MHATRHIAFVCIKTNSLCLSPSLPFLKFCSSEAIQRTESYEYAQSLGSQPLSLPNFQVRQTCTHAVTLILHICTIHINLGRSWPLPFDLCRCSSSSMRVDWQRRDSALRPSITVRSSHAPCWACLSTTHLCSSVSSYRYTSQHASNDSACLWGYISV